MSDVLYEYSALGYRLGKTNTSGTTYYVHDLSDMLCELDDSGVTQTQYTHGPRSDEHISRYQDGESSYYHQDHVKNRSPSRR